MAFTNTVEALGDAVLTNSIIDRSITELHDDIITAIGRGALHGCSALKNVNFKGVTEIGENAFESCTGLKRAEFHNTVNEIKASAFYDCTSLEALILRGQKGSVVSGAFNSSAIVAGTGYIYVPAALLEEYKADAVWGTVQSQIRAIEDYPEICDPYSWESVFKSIDAGTYKDVYKIGDLVPLDLGSEGLINMQIAAFDTDDIADGSGKAPITWISKELLKTSKRFSPALVKNDDGTYREGTGAIGGWEKSELRSYYQNTLLPLIPEPVSSAIKAVTKTHPAYDTAGSKFTQTTADEVWIPSGDNIRSSTCTYRTLFPDNASKIKYKAGATSASNWWIMYAGGAVGYNTISYNGSDSIKSSDDIHSMVLCFCT